VNYDLTSPADREDRRKHLELVSNIIGRMASSSAAAKGWSVTLAGAAFGVALVRSSWYLLVLGIAVLAAFAVIDGLYLHNERKFRDLYDAIVENQIKPLSMRFDGIPTRPVNQSYVSWSVFGFYVPLMGAGLVLLAISLAHSK
jgi:hypothetical protein